MHNDSRHSSLGPLLSHGGLVIRQRSEGGELLGFEGANSYEIFGGDGRLAFVARERQGGFLKGLFRQLGGHTLNPFDIDVYDVSGRPLMTLSHPSSWLMQRVEVYTAHGRFVGSFEECFTWINKRMLVKGADGRPRMEMDGRLLEPWRHAFTRATPGGASMRVGFVEKQWDGLLRELFTDADTFRLTYGPGPIDLDDRALLLGAALFIDLVWFEQNANA